MVRVAEASSVRVDDVGRKGVWMGGAVCVAPSSGCVGVWVRRLLLLLLLRWRALDGLLLLLLLLGGRTKLIGGFLWPHGDGWGRVGLGACSE